MSLSGRSVLALVPARGQSTGIRRKNLTLLRGRPLVEHTIRAALGARSVDATYLSSDDPEILEVGLALGARVVERPAEWATDDAAASDVVRHFLDWLPAALRDQDPYIAYLQPTSPMRTAHHIDSALNLLEETSAHSLVSVLRLQKSPFKSFTIDEDGRLQSLFDEHMSNMRRQDLPETYTPNGAIYLFSVEEFVRRGGFPSNGSVPFFMSPNESIDIDDAQDLARAERLMGA